MDKSCSFIKPGVSILLMFILALLFGTELFIILTENVPRELREATIAIYAKSFAEGVNLYSVDIMGGELPTVTNVYGVVAPLVLAPFVKVGVYLVTGHYRFAS